jgi:hypothetical protein
MNADQIAEIRPAIREAITGAPHTCVTLEIEGEPDKWMQLVDRTINAAYPHRDSPEDRLKSLPLVPRLIKVAGWEAQKFATFEFDGLEATTLAHWIDAYFVAILSCAPGEYHVDVTSEQL